MPRMYLGAVTAVMFTMVAGQSHVALGQAKSTAPPTVRTINVPQLVFEGAASLNRTIDVAPLVFEGVSAQNKTIDVSPLVFEGDYVAQKAAPSVPTPRPPSVQIKGVQK